MNTNERFMSLLDEQDISHFDYTALSSLNSPQEISETPYEEVTPEDEKQKLITEHNTRIIKSPEYQAKIIFEQHIANAMAQGIYYTGSQKKTIYRQFLRKAKKGRYMSMFDEDAQRRRAEKMKAKFEKLNNPQVVHSVDEIPQEAQDRLLEMVNEEPWHELKPEIQNNF